MPSLPSPLAALLLLTLAAPSWAETASEPGSCDLDEDGHDALFCGGDDCNDGDGSIFGGAEEVPEDGVDQDCDGMDPVPGLGSDKLAGGSGTCTTTAGGFASGLGVVLLALCARRRRG